MSALLITNNKISLIINYSIPLIFALLPTFTGHYAPTGGTTRTIFYQSYEINTLFVIQDGVGLMVKQQQEKCIDGFVFMVN